MPGFDNLYALITTFFESLNIAGFLEPVLGIVEIVLSPLYFLALIFGPLFGLPY
jgi:hypothetical protein